MNTKSEELSERSELSDEDEGIHLKSTTNEVSCTLTINNIKNK